MTFGEMVDVLGKELGMEIVDEGGATAVQVDDTPVVLQTAGEDLVLIYADLGDIPPEKRDKVLAAAMDANFLYQGTGGATLAVDPGNGHLFLQKYNWLDRLDAEKAVVGLTHFADTIKMWKGLVAEVMTGGTSSSGDLPAPSSGGFIQV